MNKTILFSAMLMSVSFLFQSCSKDEEEHHEEELITTLQLHFTPQSGGATQTFVYRDADGPGGATPVVDDIILDAGTVYQVHLEVLNESITPAEDITPEILSEADAHRFYYLPSTTSNLTFSNYDTDDNGVTLGLAATATTGTPSSGTLRMVLRHYPGNPPGKEETDDENSPKSTTDIDVVFATEVQ
jgi:hypothetical protein